MRFDSSSYLVVHFVVVALHLSYGVESDGSHCIYPISILFLLDRGPFRELLGS